jgi:hypothetical protein
MTRTPFAVFADIAAKLSAVGIALAAEILGSQWYDEPKNSGGARCYAAVPRCF